MHEGERDAQRVSVRGMIRLNRNKRESKAKSEHGDY